jgi:hypothetical protein
VRSSVNLAALISPDEPANVNLTEGYIIRNTEAARGLPEAKNYVKPVPTGEINLYKTNGYVLTQTEEWQ